MRPLHGCLILPLLAACAASAPAWEKSGASETALNEDLQQCRLSTRLSPQPSVLAAPVAQSGTPMIDRGQERDSSDAQRVGQCMQGKGYSLKR